MGTLVVIIMIAYVYWVLTICHVLTYLILTMTLFRCMKKPRHRTTWVTGSSSHSQEVADLGFEPRTSGHSSCLQSSLYCSTLHAMVLFVLVTSPSLWNYCHGVSSVSVDFPSSPSHTATRPLLIQRIGCPKWIIRTSMGIFRVFCGDLIS